MKEERTAWALQIQDKQRRHAWFCAAVVFNGFEYWDKFPLHAMLWKTRDEARSARKRIEHWDVTIKIVRVRATVEVLP